MINSCIDNLIITINGYSNQGTFSTNNIMKNNILNSLAHLSTYKCYAKIRPGINAKYEVQNKLMDSYEYDFSYGLYSCSNIIYSWSE